MNAQKFTQKSLETIQLANNLALENNNMQIEQEHLLYALLKIDQSLIAQLLKKMGKDPQAFMQAVKQEIDKMPGVKKGEYFYALGSLAKHKNFKWIREVARRSPDKTFVVAGGKDLRAFGDDAEAKDTHNVFYPGYVSDAENAALMKHCKLFLHPAVFEGFGIPPLEALALGAPVALANATCLPELYGDTARYFDPYDYDVDLDALAAQPVAAPDEVLKKYSWDKTAEFWLHEMEKYAKQ